MISHKQDTDNLSFYVPVVEEPVTVEEKEIDPQSKDSF